MILKWKRVWSLWKRTRYLEIQCHWNSEMNDGSNFFNYPYLHKCQNAEKRTGLIDGRGDTRVANDAEKGMLTRNRSNGDLYLTKIAPFTCQHSHWLASLSGVRGPSLDVSEGKLEIKNQNDLQGELKTKICYFCGFQSPNNCWYI